MRAGDARVSRSRSHQQPEDRPSRSPRPPRPGLPDLVQPAVNAPLPPALSAPAAFRGRTEVATRHFVGNRPCAAELQLPPNPISVSPAFGDTGVGTSTPRAVWPCARSLGRAGRLGHAGARPGLSRPRRGPPRPGPLASLGGKFPRPARRPPSHAGPAWRALVSATCPHGCERKRRLRPSRHGCSAGPGHPRPFRKPRDSPHGRRRQGFKAPGVRSTPQLGRLLAV